MVKRRFVCKRCGKTFVKEVYEEGETEEKYVPTSPVRCPHCGSQQITPA